jgi:hypothetical protein
MFVPSLSWQNDHFYYGIKWLKKEGVFLTNIAAQRTANLTTDG